MVDNKYAFLLDHHSRQLESASAKAKGLAKRLAEQAAKYSAFPQITAGEVRDLDLILDNLREAQAEIAKHAAVVDALEFFKVK